MSRNRTPIGQRTGGRGEGFTIERGRSKNGRDEAKSFIGRREPLAYHPKMGRYIGLYSFLLVKRLQTMSVGARAFAFLPERNVLIGGLILAVPLLIYCSTKPSKPLPPPIVAINFVSFTAYSTNQAAVLSFTNLGQTEVCLWDSMQLWRLVAETPAGWITNTAPFASVGGEWVPPGSNKVFAVPLPPGTIRWRISTIYGFQKSRHAPTELYNWIWRSPLVQRTPEPISGAVSWYLDLLPDPPFPSEGEVCTSLLTTDLTKGAL
jgi:hypothetical protein